MRGGEIFSSGVGFASCLLPPAFCLLPPLATKDNMTIEVDYRFPPGVDAQKQAKIIAVEQTAGTWDGRFAHREEVLRSRNVFPVLSAGIHPGIVPKALADYGQEVILNAGTGIMDHPDGPAAGVQAFFEALESLKQGKSFELETVPSGSLRRALEKWGKGR